MSVWENVKLGDVATIDRNTVNPHDLPGPTYYLGLEHIARGGEITNSSTVADAQLTSNKFQFDVRHLLYGKLRPNLAKVASPTESGVCSTDILPILPGERLNRRYLLHYLRQPSVVSYASSRASGANLPRLSPGALSSFAISLPPIPEQRRISSILDEADALRSKRRAQLAHLDELPQALFHETFHEPRDFTTLEEVAHIQGGLQVTAKRNALPETAKYLRVANVHRGYLTLGEVKTIGLTSREFVRTRLEAQDLLFVEGHANPDEVGRVARWEDEVADCVHQNHLIRARVNTSLASPIFVETWMNSPMGRKHFRRAGKTTSGLNTISSKTVRSAPLPLPPIALQRRFADKVAAIRTERDRVAKALEADEELFAALQYRAFRGEP